MMDNMKALAEQYAHEADNLDGMIKACEQRKRFAAARADPAESKRLEQLIELHQQQRDDLLAHAAWLRHYYN